MSFSDVIRNIAKTVTNKDELKEKAKDLPLLVVQTTLSAAGQALLVVDRMKNSIKGLGKKQEREEETYDSRPPTADQVTAAPAAEEAKPARKEPVIFAPRPGASEPNGVAKTKSDPVIFAPASTTDTATTDTATTAAEATATTEAAPKPAVEPEAAPAEPKAAATKTEAEPEAAVTEAESKAVVAEPEVEDEPAPAEAAAAPAEEAAEPVAKPTAAAKTDAKPVAKPTAAAKTDVEPEPAVAEPEATPAPKPKAKRAPRRKAAAPVEEPAAAPEPAAAKATDLVEPLPGYSEMTVASLRARMRGKTAEQIGDFLAYERATKARPEVVRMFENRLAKIEAGE
ncbi:hypothetical protein [Nonomuraea sp. NPDC049480]|uniref:hypothetical protein n=1 Tax=Nonomuraea sp. NPDC049480 TaxID=3364353 RepID=UPI00379EDFAC